MSAEGPSRPVTFGQAILYALSLPERLIRTIIGWGGRTGLVVLKILPRFLRGSRFYRVAVEKQLRLLAEGIGGADAPVDPVAAAASPDADYLPRKIIGGTLDNLLLVAFRVSPIWLLLALSDVMRGASGITAEILDELRKEGIVPADSKVQNLDELLANLSSFSGSIAESMDTPPLSVARLKETVHAVRESAAKVDLSTVVDLDDMKQLLASLRANSEKEGQSILRSSAEIGAHAFTRAWGFGRNLSLTALTGARVGGKTLYRELVRSYIDSAREIHRKGFLASLYEELSPQTSATRRNFDPRHVTWTEIGLSLGKLRRAAWRR